MGCRVSLLWHPVSPAWVVADIVKLLHSSGYSTAHKQLEFTRNLLRGIGMPNAQEVIKYSGGGTDGGTGKKESDFRKKWGPDVPPVMERSEIQRYLTCAVAGNRVSAFRCGQAAVGRTD
jgi:hypothetical protein